MPNNKRYPQSLVPIRKTSELLPAVFNTPANSKFLSGVLDPLVQPGVLEKTVGYIGRRFGETFIGDDIYIDNDESLRSRYQLEPGVIFKDNEKITDFYDYLDFKNQIKFFNNVNDRDDKITAQEHYTWNPPIDWDKFINFREYFWVPAGPPSVEIAGQFDNIVSTYSVKEGTQSSFIFTPDGMTNNPTITLYRGQTYKFKVNCPEEGFAIRTNYDTGSLRYDSNFPYYRGQLAVQGDTIWQANRDILAQPGNVITEDSIEWDKVAIVSAANALDYNDGVENNGVTYGTLTFTVPYDAPDVLFYQGLIDYNRVGRFIIESVISNTSIDVENEIIGKATYKSSNDVELTNGLIVTFTGKVTPEKYATGEWLVEGVGNAITLTKTTDLLVPPIVAASDAEVLFDDAGFDTMPFDDAAYIPTDKDYITIAKNSLDANPWSRYNRWFHRSVLEYAYNFRGQTFNAAEEARAKRPIIEFLPNIQLYNHGSKVKPIVDYVDDYTDDVFSKIEGQTNYNVDNEYLFDGARLLVIADTDKLANNRIYEVKFITHLGNRQITLIETEDSAPMLNECVIIARGKKDKGTMFHFDGTSWIRSQKKTSVNQPPLFDAFDEDGISFTDSEVYADSSFAGTKLVSYKIGNSTIDTELGFSVDYQNIDNVGDMLFEWAWDTEQFIYTQDQTRIVKKLATGFYKENPSETFLNGWILLNEVVAQPIVDALIINEVTDTLYFETVNWDFVNFDEILISFYRNGKKTNIGWRFVNNTFVFDTEFLLNDVISIKIVVDTTPVSGYYELPLGLEKNPLNKVVTSFTYGQAIDHITSAMDFNLDLYGPVTGNCNLRDISGYNLSAKRFLKHAGSAPLALGLLCDKKNNIIKSLQYAKHSYTSFKNNFLERALEIEFDDNMVNFLDDVIAATTKTKTSSSPWSDSDMIGSGAYSALNYVVEDEEITTFALSTPFSLNKLSRTAVYVYLNGKQLLHNVGYTFNETFGFVLISAELAEGDKIEIREYVSTASNHIPPTPTSLGLYKKYTPMMFVDDTYHDPQLVIQGHDGSITVAFGDFRDELLLELEYRIYNNIKQEYDSSIFDVDSVVGGYYSDGLFTKTQLDEIVIPEFLKWIQHTNINYTENTYFKETEPFTYTYSNMTDPTKTQNLPGYWRGVYMWAYDTDRPHRCPWEMLGFSQMPDWWEEEYGVAPYTSNNLLLWEDLEAGIIVKGEREGTYPRYARPGLLGNLPVDGNGILLNPLDSGFATNFTLINNKGDFKLGDVAPAEYAWRSSSEWPFVISIAMSLLKPFEFITNSFDRATTTLNKIGQTVNSITNEFITPEDIVVPDIDAAQAAGLVQYVVGYIKSTGRSATELEDWVLSIDVNLSSRLSGFVDKAEQKYMLDSKSPGSLNDSVFIPPENYDIIFNVSSPIKSVTYSGVMLEKVGGGWTLSGYDTVFPYFGYYKPVPNLQDPVITVGGETAKFTDWDSDKTYYVGQLIRHSEEFFECIESHRSEYTFNPEYWKKLAKLPIVGGVTAIRRDKFNKIRPSRFSYGTKLTTIQAVVDFLLGYAEYLKDQGFVFDNYDYENRIAQDWVTSAKEFMYWTRHNWAEGALITLSPAALKATVTTPVGVVDNFIDSFYDYQILKSNGLPLPIKNLEVTRDFRTITLNVINTNDGFYYLKLFYVLKEHVVVFSDKTVFNDVIYDETTGYRQERIKVRGFRTTDWDGDYTSPGFIFDNVSVDAWAPFTNYKLGDIVSYKSFYWTSQVNQVNQELFDTTKWVRTDSKLQKKLITNFDYKIKQIEDYYNVNAEGIGDQVRNLARHAVGYQPRTYLQDLAENPITQFQLYQGFIGEKGTNNAIVKVFDKLSDTVESTIKLNEEWAFRMGQLGGVDQLSEFEFTLNRKNFKLNPQPLSLVSTLPWNDVYFQYYIIPEHSFSINSNGEMIAFNPTSLCVDMCRAAGYVKTDHVTYTIKSKDDLLNTDTINIDELHNNEYVWVTFDRMSWTVLRYELTVLNVVSFEQDDTGVVTLELFQPHDIQINDLISISNIENLTGIFNVYCVGPKTISILPQDPTKQPKLVDDTTINDIGIGKFVKARVDSFDSLGDEAVALLPDHARVWVDKNKDNLWEVVEKQLQYKEKEIVGYGVTEPEEIGSAILYNEHANHTITCMPKPGVVAVYIDSNDTLALKQILPPPLEFEPEMYSYYGKVLALSPDGKWLAVGAPEASAFPDPANPTDHRRIKWLDNGRLNTLSRAPDDNTLPWFEHQGVVVLYEYVKHKWVYHESIVSPFPANNEQFGSAISISFNKDTEYYMTVSAKGYHPDSSSADVGTTYLYTFSGGEWHQNDRTFDGTDWVASPYDVFINTIDADLENNDQFGFSQDMSSNGNTLVIGVPHDNRIGEDSSLEHSVGKVIVYRRDAANYNYEVEQIISINDSASMPNDQFGYCVALSKDAKTLVVTAPNIDFKVEDQGAAFIYEYKQDANDSAFSYQLVQEIESFEAHLNESFGISAAIDSETIVIGARNTPTKVVSEVVEPGTEIDEDETTFFDVLGQTGAVYVFEHKTDTYFLTEKLLTDVQEGELFGYCVDCSGSVVVVGSPQYKKDTYKGITPVGNVRLFRKDADVSSLTTIALEQPLVDIEKIRSIELYDNVNKVKIAELDYVDHVKLKILNIAEQELTFKTLYDPATYNVGTDNQVVSRSQAWAEQHVGKLWWDVSTVKWLYYEQSDFAYKTGNWNKLAHGATVNVYEWVESKYLPSEWSELADTNEGLAVNISGQPMYADDTVYTVKEIYNPLTDEVMETFYYYWVEGIVVVPDILGRRTSAAAVASLIENPAGSGLPYIAVVGEEQFLAYNFLPILKSDNVSINVQHINDTLVTLNPIHNEYVLLTEDVASSVPPAKLEEKWIDSLVGTNAIGARVPDAALTEKMKYGLLFRPIQSMFVDRVPILHTVVDIVNRVLKIEPFTDTINFENLLLTDEAPSNTLNIYDVAVNSIVDLHEVGTVRVKQAKLKVNIVKGKVDTIDIVNKGFGYRTPPTVTITGDGKGALAEVTIDREGRINSVTIRNRGKNYSRANIVVRQFAVLVNSDKTANNFWSIYAWDDVHTTFFRRQTQAYDTPKYWDYIDWWKEGYGIKSRIVKEVPSLFTISMIQLAVGDLVRIKEFSNGGWAVFKKVQETDVFSLGYEIVGRENGTIKLLATLYDKELAGIGYDYVSEYDIKNYDFDNARELRNILLAVKEDIFVGNYAVEWNKLFFACVKYAFVEQPFIDWAFKTSFLNVTHNIGELEKRVNYTIENLGSYEDYINEVKPYRTTLREYIGKYTATDPTQTAVADFDLPAVYSEEQGKIVPVTENSAEIFQYPWRWWLDNQGYSIAKIEVSASGEDYLQVPGVIIEGDGEGATAQAYIANGRVSHITVVNEGSGYTKTPTVRLVGGNTPGSPIAVATPILGNAKVRTLDIGMKFDRITKQGRFAEFTQVDTFVATGFTSAFDLQYAPTYDKSKIRITIDNHIVLFGDYRVELYTTNNGSYSVLQGRIVFNKLPLEGMEVVVEYEKNDDYLDSVNRINKYYNPTSGMKGTDPEQLMTGIDFGGVRVQGTTFDVTGGWDALPWYTDNWDSVESDNDYYERVVDEININVWPNGDWSVLALPYVPSDGQLVTIYYLPANSSEYTQPVRIDDPAFGFVDSSTIVNENAIMPTFIGDGSTMLVDIEPYLTLELGDTIVFRNEESDGTVTITDVNILDTDMSGGELTVDPTNGSYSTATGLTADEIAILGGMLVEPAHVPAPEENVPGQVLDSLSIRVFSSEFEGAAPIQVTTQLGNDTRTIFNIGVTVVETASITVYVDKIKRELGSGPLDYSINFITNTIEFISAPAAYEVIEIIAIGIGGISILDYQEFIADGQTSLFLTDAVFDDTKSIFVTLDGTVVEVNFTNSGDIIDVDDKTLVVFGYNPDAGSVIKIISFGYDGPDDGLMPLVRINQQSIIYDGSTSQYELDNFVNVSDSPAISSIIVEIDGKALRGVDTVYAEYDGVTTEFIMQPGTLSSNLTVYVDDTLLTFIEDYNYDSVTREVSINQEVLDNNSAIQIINNMYAEYAIEGINIVINDDVLLPVSPGATIDIIWFSRYEAMQMLSDEYEGGKVSYKLLRRPLGADYVWVYKNGERLTATVDYTVEVPNSTVKLLIPNTSADIIKIIVFGSDIYRPTSAYEIHKDMLNTHQYNSYSLTNVKLVEDLAYYDDTIYMNDVSALDDPVTNTNKPGMLLIDGERITYMVKDVAANTVSQLRRGVNGTSTSELYDVDTPVVNVGRSKLIPYSDTENNQTFPANDYILNYEGNGVDTEFDLTFAVFEQDSLHVYIDDNIIVNGYIVNEITSEVIFATAPALGAKIRIVSLLIGPMGSPLSRTDREWVREEDSNIPDNYGPCDEVEIFTAGQRLRKDPMWIYNEKFGIASPESDVYVDAEFAVNGVSNYVRLTNDPIAGTLIAIVRRTGQIWYNVGNTTPSSGITLLDNDTPVVEFIVQNTSFIPE